MTTSGDEIANWEIFLWALGILGGADTFIDVEDVFIRCFDLAPKRFSWRSRPDLPDYKKCSKALRDAEAKGPHLLLKTQDGLRRQLTAEGQDWIKSNERRMVALLHSDLPVQEPRTRPRVRLLADVERSDLFQSWRRTGELSTEKWRFAELLKCSPDSDWRTWRNRLQSLRAAAKSAERLKTLEFLTSVAATHPDWFGEEAS
jgi:hypothetical protein